MGVGAGDTAVMRDAATARRAAPGANGAMRRVRRPALVITFASTAAAVACEEACRERGLPGRTVPVPGSVRAGCGLAWKAAPSDRAALETGLAAAGVPVEGMQVIELWEFERVGAAPGISAPAGTGDPVPAVDGGAS